jgi:hypothetical protein
VKEREREREKRDEKRERRDEPSKDLDLGPIGHDEGSVPQRVEVRLRHCNRSRESGAAMSSKTRPVSERSGREGGSGRRVTHDVSGSPEPVSSLATDGGQVVLAKEGQVGNGLVGSNVAVQRRSKDRKQGKTISYDLSRRITPSRR